MLLVWKAIRLPSGGLVGQVSCEPAGQALLFLDQIKREKGVWWMPWQQEAMKDVILCDKP